MKLHNVSLLAAFVIAIVLTSHWLGQESYHWLAPAASLEAEEVGHLFSFLVSLASVVFLGVIGMMAYSMWVYRSSADDSSDGPAIRGHSAVEITWTVIPVLLVIWIASYSFVIYQRMSLLGSPPWSTSITFFLARLPTPRIPVRQNQHRSNRWRRPSKCRPGNGTGHSDTTMGP